MHSPVSVYKLADTVQPPGRHARYVSSLGSGLVTVASTRPPRTALPPIPTCPKYRHQCRRNRCQISWDAWAVWEYCSPLLYIPVSSASQKHVLPILRRVVDRAEDCYTVTKRAIIGKTGSVDKTHHCAICPPSGKSTLFCDLRIHPLRAQLFWPPNPSDHSFIIQPLRSTRPQDRTFDLRLSPSHLALNPCGPSGLKTQDV